MIIKYILLTYVLYICLSFSDLMLVVVAMARSLFPLEARLAMQIAHADSTMEFAGLSASNGVLGSFKEVDLNEIPSDYVRRLYLRLQALQKTGNFNLNAAFPFYLNIL